MGNFLYHFVPDKLAKLLNFLLMTAWAEVALLATECDEVVVSAMITMQAGEAVTEIATDFKCIQRFLHLRAQSSVLLLETCLVLFEKCIAVFRQALP